ncbi:glucokinase [Thiosocius teredinicola]|uniref:glucokinase n=1 Tax=Thiosocius teredinicola TaxID=1973002 RepID=UPI000991349B
MISLAADIGGTYSRLAWSETGPHADVVEQTFDNSDFDTLEGVIDEGLKRYGSDHAIDNMVLAVPGPVHRDPVELTNINWSISRASLKAHYATERLTIVNDFQAAAMGAISASPDDMTTLNSGSHARGPLVVTGAGTGLGMAWFADSEAPGLPRATEGGHIDFAPNAAKEVEFYRWLAAQFGHVSYERILSGSGLQNTYRFVSGDEGADESPAQIVALAKQNDSAATQSITTFVRIFAAYAGNLALAFNPTGGIYLCGGLTAHLAKWFTPAIFVDALTAKGRMADVVRRIPIYLVTRPDTGLAGARRIAQEIYRADT